MVHPRKPQLNQLALVLIQLVQLEESVTGPSLNERLAEFKRDKASKEGRVLLENIGVTTAPAVTSTGKRKANHAFKRGDEVVYHFRQTKALERRYR